MRIDSHIKPSAVAQTGGLAKAQTATASQDQVDFAATDKLEKALAETPDIRAEKVARAKALVNAPGYPPKEVLETVANIIAGHNTQQG